MNAPAKAWLAELVSVVDVIILTTVGLVIVACSGGDASEASEANGVDSSDAVAAAAPASEPVTTPDAIRTDIEVCELLTDEQVATVLPGHEGGFEAASGEALFGDETRSYKCSYDVEEAGDVYFFTIDLTVGPFGVMSYESGRQMAEAEGDIHRKVQVADGGWVELGDEWMGETIPYVYVAVLKGPAEISLRLITPDAHGKVDAVVDLATAVAAALD